MDFFSHFNENSHSGVILDIIGLIIKECILLESEEVLFKLACVNHLFSQLSHKVIIEFFEGKKTISNRALSHFPEEMHLNLCSIYSIQDFCLKSMTNLVSLNLCYNRRITNDGIRSFSFFHPPCLSYSFKYLT